MAYIMIQIFDWSSIRKLANKNHRYAIPIIYVNLKRVVLILGYEGVPIRCSKIGCDHYCSLKFKRWPKLFLKTENLIFMKKRPFCDNPYAHISFSETLEIGNYLQTGYC